MAYPDGFGDTHHNVQRYLVQTSIFGEFKISVSDAADIPRTIHAMILHRIANNGFFSDYIDKKIIVKEGSLHAD